MHQHSQNLLFIKDNRTIAEADDVDFFPSSNYTDSRVGCGMPLNSRGTALKFSHGLGFAQDPAMAMYIRLEHLLANLKGKTISLYRNFVVEDSFMSICWGQLEPL